MTGDDFLFPTCHRAASFHAPHSSSSKQLTRNGSLLMELFSALDVLLELHSREAFHGLAHGNVCFRQAIPEGQGLESL